MKVYQRVTGYERSILDLEISVDNYSSGIASGFLIAIGDGLYVTGAGGSTGLANSGIMFSGHNGYIFDQSGRFVGGYYPDSNTEISIHNKNDGTFSYFINGDFIANNMNGLTGFEVIEFEKYLQSSLSIGYTHE